MARFEPFAGLRYDTGRVDPADVTSPPYDVIDEAERAALAAQDPHQAVPLDLPVDEGGVARYTVASRLLQDWRGEGVLVEDEEPSLYVYRMGYKDDTGRLRPTPGGVGGPHAG